MEGELPWLGLARQLGADIAALIGASPAEVIVTNTTTVNLHQLLATFYNPRASRTIIVADGLLFPSDRYALQSHLQSHGHDPATQLRLVSSGDGYTLSEEKIIAAMTDDVQLVLLPSVVHSSGQLLDIKRLAHASRERGILLGIDCSHSVGVVPHHFSEDGVDFAFWCTYKYLNGGPGSVGGLFVHARHLPRVPGMAGWFSGAEADLFKSSATLVPADDARSMQISTPSVLGMAPLVGSLEMIQDAGIEAIRQKSVRLTTFMIELIACGLEAHGFEIITPRDAERRGGHIAIRHDAASRISKAWRASSVIADFRAPNILRVAPGPLYTSFQDCYEALSRLKRIMDEQTFAQFTEEPDVIP